MALTDTQKSQIRLYLGYSDQSRNTPVHWPLENAMLALSSTAETIVTGILTQLATVDADLTTVSGSSRAGLKSVDNGGVVWQDSVVAPQSAVSAQGRRLVQRLARTLGVGVVQDMFGSGPTSGLMGLG